MQLRVQGSQLSACGYSTPRVEIGGYVENVFGGGWIGHRHPLSDKIMLVDVSLAPGVGLHAADSHRSVVGRWSNRL